LGIQGGGSTQAYRGDIIISHKFHEFLEFYVLIREIRGKKPPSTIKGNPTKEAKFYGNLWLRWIGRLILLNEHLS
jgi:hypothetical protein